MSKPIEPTPPLRGEDARKLEASLKKGASADEMSRRVKAAEEYLSNPTQAVAVTPRTPR